MRFKIVLIILCLLLTAIVTSTFASTSKVNGFTKEQQAQIKVIIHNYLIQNPQVLVEASQALQEQQMQKLRRDAIKAARISTDDLLRSNSPAVGASRGLVTVVAFLDYQCPFCRLMSPRLEHLIKTNPKMRVVFKEFPIHGQYSIMSAKAALAASLQGKYWEMHKALMKAKMPLTEQEIMDVAKSTGLDMKKLAVDMRKPWVKQEIDNVYRLAKKLNLIGDPSFFIMKSNMTDNSKDQIYFIAGYVSEQELQGAINKLE
ncbi:MAG: DsbA family protein [Gammaproteobacteria bacterium]|jgi:protein-disulfide isomerase